MFLSQKLVINLLSILIYLIPISLVTGPFLPDFFLVIFSSIFIITIIVEREYKYFKIKLFYLFVLFYLYILLNSLFSENIFLSLESSLFYFRFGIFALGIWYVLDKNPRFLYQFFFILLLTFLIVVIDAYIQFFTGSNLIGYQKDEIRVSGFFNDIHLI